MHDRRRTWITALVTLFIWTLLGWEHFHGGVASHHFLHRADLPAISNWWGGLLLPVLTWFLLGRIHRRSAVHRDGTAGTSRYPRTVVAGFAGALLYGISLSTAFTLDYSAATSLMFQALFLLALFFPIYRAESVLGFVLGMTFTFGAILPTLVGSVVAVIAMLIYRYVRPVLTRFLYWIVRVRTSAAG
jgi:hypothetical protein